MRELDSLGSFEDQVAALEEAMAGARDVTSGLNAELDRAKSAISDTSSGVRGLSTSLGRNLSRAFESVVFDGAKLSDALVKVGRSMADSAFSAAMRPVSRQFGSMLTGGVQNLVAGVLPFAKGGAFSQGRVRPFASGGVVDGPAAFPMRGGLGLMGEAGPEAILPLGRGRDGRLGVRSDGGGRPVHVTFNITTPDVEGSRTGRRGSRPAPTPAPRTR